MSPLPDDAPRRLIAATVARSSPAPRAEATGPAEPITRADLDDAADYWRQHAPSEFRDLLDAEPEDPT